MFDRTACLGGLMVEPLPYQVIPAVATLLSAMLAIAAWERRPARGSVAFAALLIGVGVWSAAYTLELSATTLGATLYWSKVTYLGTVAVPATWLVFALRFGGLDEWITRRTVAALLVEPVIVLGLVWTHGTAGPLWRSVSRSTVGSVSRLAFDYTALFWLHAGYSYVIILVGIAVLWRTLAGSPRVHQQQVQALAAAAVLPLLGNLLFLADIGPGRVVDLTSFGFAMGGLLLFRAFLRHRLLDFRGAARERALDLLDAGVFLLGTDLRVVDCNDAAIRLAGRPKDHLAGRPLGDALGGVDPFDAGDNQLYVDELDLDVGDERRRFSLTLSSVYHRQGDVMGRVAILQPMDGRLV